MSGADDSDDLTFDVYARPFVPQILRDINVAPANLVSSTAPRTIDYDAYSRRFAGLDMLPDQPAQQMFSTEAAKVTSPPWLAPTSQQADTHGEDKTQPGPLTSISYAEYFYTALRRECGGLERECEDQAIFQTSIGRHPNDQRPFVYMLTVPGLR